MAPSIAVNIDLLTTNRPPTDEEFARLTQHIQVHRTRISELDANMSRLTKELEALKEERDALVAEAAPVMQALAPIRRVPEDVLREIFVACINPHRNPVMSNTEAPVLLMQICSDMRRVALTTPALWAAIHIAVTANHHPMFKEDFKAEQIMEKRNEAVYRWLRRSGNLPLSISVFEKRPVRPMAIENRIPLVMDIICDFSLRWKTMHFSTPPHSIARITALALQDMPLLQSVTFTCTKPRDDGTGIAGSKVLSAPMLTNLGLNIAADLSRLSDTVAWRKLTHIHFPSVPFGNRDAWSMNDVGNILRQTTCLISCNVFIHRDVRDMEAIHLHFLKALTINDKSRNTPIVGFLAAIRAPVLDVLSLNTTPFSGRQPHPPNDSLIELFKHSPSVTELAMDIGEEESHIVNCLLHCPELRTLHLQSPRSDGQRFPMNLKTPESAIMDALAPDEGCLSVCPKLEHFRWSHAPHLSPISLQKFLTRKRHVTGSDLAQWKTVIMEFEVRPDDMDTFIDIQSRQLGKDTNFYIGGSLRNDESKESVYDGISDLGPVDSIWPSNIPRLHLL